jgi:septal ring factor EnvC (AmiA/AmiB activator)
MKTIFLNNYKTLLYILFGVGALYLMVLFFTPKPEMSELDKYKLNQLNKDIQDIKNNQIKLDSTINNYEKEISKIDSTLAKVRNQKTIVKEYYKEKGEEITGMKPSQIDSLFHKRYKY